MEGVRPEVCEPVEEGIIIHDNDNDFKRALFVAAIITNDIALVENQLSHLRDSLICSPTGGVSRRQKLIREF